MEIVGRFVSFKLTKSLWYEKKAVWIKSEECLNLWFGDKSLNITQQLKSKLVNIKYNQISWNSLEKYFQNFHQI